MALALRLRMHKQVFGCSRVAMFVCVFVCVYLCVCAPITRCLSNSFHQHRLSNAKLHPQVGRTQLVQTQVHTAQHVIWKKNTQMKRRAHILLHSKTQINRYYKEKRRHQHTHRTQQTLKQHQLHTHTKPRTMDKHNQTHTHAQ